VVPHVAEKACCGFVAEYPQFADYGVEFSSSARISVACCGCTCCPGRYGALATACEPVIARVISRVTRFFHLARRLQGAIAVLQAAYAPIMSEVLPLLQAGQTGLPGLDSENLTRAGRWAQVGGSRIPRVCACNRLDSLVALPTPTGALCPKRHPQPNNLGVVSPHWRSRYILHSAYCISTS